MKECIKRSVFAAPSDTRRDAISERTHIEKFFHFSRSMQVRERGRSQCQRMMCEKLHFTSFLLTSDWEIIRQRLVAHFMRMIAKSTKGLLLQKEKDSERKWQLKLHQSNIS